MITPDKIKEIRTKYGIANPVSAPVAGETPQDKLSFLKGTGAPKETMQPETPEKTPSFTERIGDILNEGADKYGAAEQRQAAGEQGSLETGFQKFGQGLGTATDVAFETLKSIPVVGSLLKGGEKVLGAGVKKVLETDSGRKALEAYNNLDDRTKADLGSLFEIVTAVAGGASAKPGAKIIAKGGEAALQAGETALEAAAKNSAKKTVTKALEATGKVLQGQAKDIKPGVKILADLDVKGIKTYKDLSTVLDNSIKKNLGQVDKIYEGVGGSYKLGDLGIKTSTKSGEQVFEATQNYVDDALKQLSELYSKTNEPALKAKVDFLIKKGNEEGLTAKEINQIARDYGTEFGQKAFSPKNGEALTSVNAQAYENTRKGVKDTARSFLPDDAAKALDQKVASQLNVKRLVDNMAKKVNALQQRVGKRGLGEKAGRALAQFADIATFGGLKGFVTKLFPSNVGLKTLNSIDLENMLGKMLKQIKKLEKVNDANLPQAILDFTKDPKLGMSINAITPETVAKKVSTEDLGIIREYLGKKDVDTFMKAQPMIDAMGLKGMDAKTLDRFLNEVLDLNTKKLAIKSKK